MLVPQPSDDPNDPLNWPKWKKALAVMSLCCFVGLTNWVIAGIGSGILLIMEDYEIDLNTAVTGTISWCILTLGLGVRPQLAILIYRTSFGFLRVHISVDDRSTCLLHFSSLAHSFGLPLPIISKVKLLPVFFKPLWAVQPKD